MFQYHVPKTHNETESYALCVLFLLHPIKVEFHLKSGSPLPPLPSSSQFFELYESGEIDIKPFKKNLTVAFGDLVTEVFLRLRAELLFNFHSHTQQGKI